jgi:hypothetical protein
MTQLALCPATCATAGCSVVRVFSFSMSREETGRLQRKVLAVAGWLVLDGGHTFCESCSEMLRRAMNQMPINKARAVRSALSDALHLRRMDVSGVG